MNADRPPIVPVVLSGGSGTRLWPESRARQPKQLLPLVGDHSLIQETVDRLESVPGIARPIVVTNAAHAIAIDRALASSALGGATLILEPVGRNTAPAVAVAAHAVLGLHDDALMLVLPSDHAITRDDIFATAVSHAAAVAEQGYLVTFGISPTSPETGYGYIRAGRAIDDHAFVVEEFKEKPDRATAEQYVASGDYSWNSGMFLFSARLYLSELTSHRPDIAEASALAYGASATSGDRVTLDASTFASCPSQSIDFAVMEPTHSAAVIPVDPGWSDVGSWTSLWEISPHDEHGNTLLGDVVAVDTDNSYVRATSRLVATAGVERLVVVETADSVLVTTTDSSQAVRDIVDSLKDSRRPEIDSHGTEFEEWGVSEHLASGPGYHARLMRIDPLTNVSHASDSGAMTFLRVVRGVAEIDIDGVPQQMGVGRAVSVPAGAPSTIRNLDNEVLMIVEVRVDTDIDEDERDTFIGRRNDR